MSLHASRCRNLSPTKWAEIREKGIAFCDQFGETAHRLGWTVPGLFAVHPEHGTIRLNACGVLMIGGEPARGRGLPGAVREDLALLELSILPLRLL